MKLRKAQEENITQIRKEKYLELQESENKGATENWTKSMKMLNNLVEQETCKWIKGKTKQSSNRGKAKEKIKART